MHQTITPRINAFTLLRDLVAACKDPVLFDPIDPDHQEVKEDFDRLVSDASEFMGSALLMNRRKARMKLNKV